MSKQNSSNEPKNSSIKQKIGQISKKKLVQMSKESV